MKRFKFRLESVLKIKSHLEELRRMELSEAENRCVQARIEFRQRQQDVEDTTKVCRAQMQNKFDPYLAGDYFHYLARLNGFVKEAAVLLKQRETEVVEARNNLVEASREKKVIEKLKEQAYQKYCTAELNEEIIFLDQLGTTRFIRQRDSQKEGNL
jgi:flagellar protein FliJ